jgi:hypothetical protein
VCAAHRERLVARHGLAGEVPQGEVDRGGLGAEPMRLARQRVADSNACRTARR